MMNRLYILSALCFILFSCKKEDGSINLNGVHSYYEIIDGDTVLAVHVPDSFTDTHDGINENYFPIINGDYLPGTYHFLINDNGGHQIFSSRDVNVGWNGHIDNRSAPDGKYYFDLYLTLLTGKELHFKGDLLLLR